MRLVRTTVYGVGVVLTLISGLSGQAEAQPFAAYIANGNGDSVSVVDVATQAVVTVPIGTPGTVAVAPDGALLYVTNPGGFVSVFDTVSLTLETTVAVGSNSYGIVATKDGTRVYVANQSDRTVSAIDTFTQSVVTTIPVPKEPFIPSVSPDGKTVYATFSDGDLVITGVFALDVATQAVTTIDLGTEAGQPLVPFSGVDPIAISPDGKKVYVTANSSVDGGVVVIDAETLAREAFVSFGRSARGVSISSNAARVYAVRSASPGNAVVVVETTTNTVAKEIPLQGPAHSVDFTPDGALAYAVLPGAPGSVAVIDTVQEEISGTFAVGNTLGGTVFGSTAPHDRDTDGVLSDTDNCRLVFNPLQTDADGDEVGDACDPCPSDPTETRDRDRDGVCDNTDNCPDHSNTDQADLDGDGSGNACDSDDDGDGVPDTVDAFPLDPSESADADGDGSGDNRDNCPVDTNPDQADVDRDGIGDVCDSVFNKPIQPGTSRVIAVADDLGCSAIAEGPMSGDGVPVTARCHTNKQDPAVDPRHLDVIAFSGVTTEDLPIGQKAIATAQLHSMFSLPAGPSTGVIDILPVQIATHVRWSGLLGAAGTNTTSAQVIATLRVRDTTTGEVVASTPILFERVDAKLSTELFDNLASVDISNNRAVHISALLARARVYAIEVEARCEINVPLVGLAFCTFRNNQVDVPVLAGLFDGDGFDIGNITVTVGSDPVEELMGTSP